MAKCAREEENKKPLPSLPSLLNARADGRWKKDFRDKLVAATP